MEGAGNKKSSAPGSSTAAKRLGQSGSGTPPTKIQIQIPEKLGNDAREDFIIREIKKETDAIKEVVKRVKVEGVKEGIEKISALLNLLVGNTNKRRTMGRQSIEQQQQPIDVRKALDEVKKDVSDLVKESKDRILGAIEQINTSRHVLGATSVSQGGNRGIIADSVTGTESDNPAPLWTEVVRRRPKNNVNTARLAPPAPPVADLRRKRAARYRPPAILVDIGREEFPALAKKLKEEAKRDIIGDSIAGIRQARSGGLLIEVRGDEDKVEAIRAEIKRSAGSNTEVRTLSKRITIEIRDIDEWTTKEEVARAVAATVGVEDESTKILGMRKLFGGSQAAIILMKTNLATKLLRAGRVLVGLISCRVRTKDNVVRCYRCHLVGHMSNGCQGTDRSECCWRCDEPGHKAVDCNATSGTTRTGVPPVEPEGLASENQPIDDQVPSN